MLTSDHTEAIEISSHHHAVLSHIVKPLWMADIRIEPPSHSGPFLDATAMNQA